MLLDPKQTMEEKQEYSTVLTAVTASAEDVLAAQSVAKRAPKEDSQYELSPQQVRVCRPS
jgi:methionine-rich copper-binding protein CopC